jgi:transposase
MLPEWVRIRAWALRVRGGLPIRQVGEILGVGKATVIRWLKRPRPRCTLSQPRRRCSSCGALVIGNCKLCEAERR